MSDCRFGVSPVNYPDPDPDPVLSGVPQGSVLGPILFFIFINDLPDNINSTVRIFADDCVLSQNIRRSEDQQILQDTLIN